MAFLGLALLVSMPGCHQASSQAMNSCATGNPGTFSLIGKDRQQLWPRPQTIAIFPKRRLTARKWVFLSS